MRRRYERFGEYELVEPLAIGGMAQLSLAYVSGVARLQRLVVIKEIRPRFADDERYAQMLLDEACITAALGHPNIVQLHDVGVVDGAPFLALEYLDGRDTRAIVKRLQATGRTLPLEHAIAIVAQVAAALHHAHERIGFDGRRLDIVHRDVTPENVIVTYDGGVKLIDFGIASAAAGIVRAEDDMIRGKPSYMSPEQRRGLPLDRRSDIFSLGVVLYQLTLGTLPRPRFRLLDDVDEPAIGRPRDRAPGYSAELEAIVLRALANDAGQRYQTARDLQADLEAWAWANRLSLSSIALGHFMQETFERRVDALLPPAEPTTIDR